MGKKGLHSFQKQPSVGQLKSALAAQVFVYHQSAVANRLTLTLAKILLCAMRRMLRLLIRLKPVLATAIVVVSPFVWPTESSANSFIKRTGSANPFASIDVGNFSVPSLADIDNDGDQDIFIGADSGRFTYYQNTGSSTNATYQLQVGSNNPLNSFDVGEYSTPRFADLDDDADLDAISGEFTGKILYYKNTGTAEISIFAGQTGTLNPFDSVDVFKTSSPTLIDIDHDGDLDVFVGI